MAKLRPAVILICFALIFSGCSPKIKSSLFYDITSSINSYDPQMAEDDSALLMAGNCFEGLLCSGADGELCSGAAESWEISDDGLTYTFKLKKGLLWSDGETALTSADFVFGFRRLFDPETKAPFRADFMAVKNASTVASGAMSTKQLGVAAPDERTLVITLEYQDPFFLELLATPAASPCNEAFFLGTRGRYGSATEYTLFNGPYSVARIKEGVYYRLSRNQSYSGTPTGYANIYLYTQTAEDYSSAARLLAGEIDAAPVTFGDVAALTGGGFSTEGYKNTVWVLAFNTADPYTSNQSVRRAIAYACDKGALEGSLPGNLEPAWSFVPPAVTLSGESYRSLAGEKFSGFDYDPEMAASLLSDGLAELGGGRLDTLTILCPEEYLSMMGLIQRSVQEGLAVFVNLVPMSNEELAQAVSSGEYQAALVPITVKYNTPAAFFSLFSSAENFTGFSSASLARVVQSAADALTLQDTVAAYSTAEQMLLQACPVFPMFFEESYFAIAPGLSGLTYSPFGSHVAFYYAE